MTRQVLFATKVVRVSMHLEVQLAGNRVFSIERKNIPLSLQQVYLMLLFDTERYRSTSLTDATSLILNETVYMKKGRSL
jgi:hypothetical protein